jgi:hypothetical protein
MARHDLTGGGIWDACVLICQAGPAPPSRSRPSRSRWPRAFPVCTPPVRFGNYPWLATAIQGYTASFDGVATGNAHSPDQARVVVAGLDTPPLTVRYLTHAEWCVLPGGCTPSMPAVHPWVPVPTQGYNACRGWVVAFGPQFTIQCMILCRNCMIQCVYLDAVAAPRPRVAALGAAVTP